MRKLVRKIEGLLSCHDCVVVPGLGGFLMNRALARYDEDSQQITPSYRQVSFNSQLTFNDGLLSQAYQSEDGVNYNEAMHAVSMAVAEIRQHLSAGETVLLGQLGYLRQMNDNRLVFTPLQCISLDADSFGLETVSCRCPDIDTSKIVSDNRNETSAPVIDLVLWKWAVSVAACVILAVAFPTRTIQQTNPVVWQASVVSPCTVAQYINRQADKSQPTEIQVIEPDLQTERPVCEARSEKEYVLVIASFSTREEAERYMAKKDLSAMYPSSGITLGDGHYRVYAEKYSSRQEAIERIQPFRSDNPQYAEVWVACSRSI